MRSMMKIFTAAVLVVVALPAAAAISVFACEQEWAALAGELAGERA